MPTPFHHDLVRSSAPGVIQANIDPLIVRSWHRSLDIYRLDPARRANPRVLSGSLLRDHQVPMEALMQIAKGGVEHLFQQVRDAGYVVLLNDAHGVTVDFQSNPELDRDLRRSGLYLGSCWSESEEGTCAVGTCIVDRAPITVHQSEHFRTTNTQLTCSASPILDTDGSLLAVLDASALASPDDKRSQALVLQLVTVTARMIENAHFLKKFEDLWIIRLSNRRNFIEVITDGLIALDPQGRIVACNHNVQHEMQTLNNGVTGKKLEDVFDQRFEDLIAVNPAQGKKTVPVRALHSGKQYFAMMRYPTMHVPEIARQPIKSIKLQAPVLSTNLTLEELAGNDPHMMRNINIIRRIINKGLAIMLQGETGTGKEAFAKAIHSASYRADCPFVALNCAAIPESLIESELFGYAEGAFTGARTKGMRGKIIQAHGGTLFLDEIGDMPLQLQTRLLRVLAEKEILPLGSAKSVQVDIQVICATHRNLLDLVVSGQFREDMYYRLNGMKLVLSPLRERTDIESLIQAILKRVALEVGRTDIVVDPNALSMMLNYSWPGNFRQLSNTLRAALALNDTGHLEMDDISSDIQMAARSALPPTNVLLPPLQSCLPSAVLAQKSEPTVLLEALKKNRWNITQAASEIGICRATLYRKMEKYRIVAPNARD
ncbi:MAG: sigma-54-dependent Fis family transcriptional regulator [Burkholderiaceae bacterium]